MLTWFSSREVSAVGVALADDFVLQAAPAQRKAPKAGSQHQDLQKLLQKFLQRVDRETRPLKLNIFKRAKLANSFKWRLAEKGVEKQLVEELTQALVLRLTVGRASAAPGGASAPPSAQRLRMRTVPTLLAQADAYLEKGASTEAAGAYQDVLDIDPRHAVARNNLGAALVRLGRYQEAESQFRRAIAIRPGYAEAHGNLGAVLQWTGHYPESEQPLRRAIKLKPASTDAQIKLGSTLVLLDRLDDARAVFDKVLKTTPRNVFAMIGLGRIRAVQGALSEAETWFKRALEVDPKVPGGWANLVELRRMTPADSAWLKGAEESAASGLVPLDEANIRFAIGKYHDDIGDFSRAFRGYQRANELLKTLAVPYDARVHAQYVDDLIRVYTRDALSGAHADVSDSGRPVLVTGMPRSGTSLVEQVIASHPAVVGAGELNFWRAAVHKHEAALRRELPSASFMRSLRDGYLRELEQHAAGAQRVVDKATVNADYLGIINLVFPKARILHLQRDPIDTCLSCYFQQFSAGLNFTMDLADLADYYRQHHRLMAHWRRTLPQGAFLDVPYAELVADQEGWTRRILEFLGLPWDDRCLSFHKTERAVTTASFWQVRQKIYKTSVGRWRNYQKFIGPLLELRHLA